MSSHTSLAQVLSLLIFISMSSMAHSPWVDLSLLPLLFLPVRSPSTSSTTSCPLSSTTRSSWKACATPPQKRVRAPWTPPTPSHFLDMGRQRICLDVQTIQKPKNGRIKGKDQKGKGKGSAYPQTEFSASENAMDEGQGHRQEPSDGYFNCSDDSSTSAWYNPRYSAWMASVPLDLAHHPTHVVLDLGCTRSMGSRTARRRFQKYALYHGITTEFCPLQEVFCVCQLWDRSLSGKLYYSFADNTTMFYQSWCAWDGRRAHPILPSPDEEFGYYTCTGSKRS